MQTSSKHYISTTDTAKMLRQALKAEFPGVKFSVRSKSYAGGSSVDASWTDGPTQDAVQAVCWRYQGASFDGMTDMKSYHDSILSTEDGAEVVSFGPDFVFAHRTISQEVRDAVAAKIAELSGEPCDLSRQGAGWNARYPVCVFEGELSRYRGLEYGQDICHQYLANRAL